MSRIVRGGVVHIRPVRGILARASPLLSPLCNAVKEGLKFLRVAAKIPALMLPTHSGAIGRSSLPDVLQLLESLQAVAAALDEAATEIRKEVKRNKEKPKAVKEPATYCRLSTIGSLPRPPFQIR